LLDSVSVCTLFPESCPPGDSHDENFPFLYGHR
jgi:hypothetical protein